MKAAEVPVGEEAAGAAGNPARRNRFLIVLVAAAVLLIAASTAAVIAIRGYQRDSRAGQRPSGIPASISDGTINLMGLAPVLARPAPGFTRTDQDGRTVPLSGLRGKVVVLEFMDPHCTDICPLVSQEFVDATTTWAALRRTWSSRRSTSTSTSTGCRMCWPTPGPTSSPPSQAGTS